MVHRKRSELKTQNSELLLFITGPTASGKSGLSMRIAQEFGGEIICADSQTVRRGMDIGTAKPSKSDQEAVPHHLLDIIDPYDRFTVAEFVERAEKAIADIKTRGKLPIIVGGTGLYVDALLYGFSFRKNLSEYSREELEAKTVSELQDVIIAEGHAMPTNDQNPRHLIRTIEARGQEPSKKTLRTGAVAVGIDPGKDELEERIRQRVDMIVESGFLEEFENILSRYGAPAERFDAIEYRVVQENSDISLDALKEKLVIGDRQYAKKQRAWMKRNTDIMWFDSPNEAYLHLSQQLN